ncbi:MAG: transcriptional regulator [Bacteriovoracaceae bacterium]|nr:transcriptional regulator [Bacteriovoracaceae bacterium]
MANTKTEGGEILSRLKSGGYRLTKIRKSLVQFILNKKGHWTIQDLVNDAKHLIPKLGVATLYRTVSLLHKENLLTETRLGGASARYEVSTQEHHDHLTCVSCGEIFEFENDRIEELQRQIAKKLGFKLIDHRMELFGECQRKPCKFKSKR